MRPYKIINLQLLEPLRVMADSRSDAVCYFLACLQRGLGGVPIIECHLDVDVMLALDEPKLVSTTHHRGFLWAKNGGWKVYDPFDERP